MHFVPIIQTNGRYDSQVAVFGAEFQKKLFQLKYFLVSSTPDDFVKLNGLYSSKMAMKIQDSELQIVM